MRPERGGSFQSSEYLVRPDSEVNLMTTSALAMRAPDSAPLADAVCMMH
jgi:hypothetical protein